MTTNLLARLYSGMVFRMTHGGTLKEKKTETGRERLEVHWEDTIQPEEELQSLLESTKDRVECLREVVTKHTQEIEDDLAALIERSEGRDYDPDEHKEA